MSEKVRFEEILRSFYLKPFIISFHLVQEPEEANIYWIAEKTCRQCAKIIASYIPVHLTLFITAVFCSIYNIRSGNLVTSTWFLPFPVLMPFDSSSILAWYAVWFLQINIGTAYVLSITSTTLYFVCCCFYIRAICEHFAWCIQAANEDIELNRNEKDPAEQGRRRQMIQNNLGKSVEIHVQLIELVFFFLRHFKLETMHSIVLLKSRTFKMVADINSGSIFALLPLNVIFAACTLYNMENVSLTARFSIASRV